MVEIFVISIESEKYGTKGLLSKKTCKTNDGIHVEFLRECPDNSLTLDIADAVSYFTRGSALRTKDMIYNEIISTQPDNGGVVIEVKPKQVSLAESRAMGQTSWTYK